MSNRTAQKMFNRTADEHQKALVSLIKAFGYRHTLDEVFADFVELSALAVSNAVDKHHFQAREERYLAIVKKYDPADFKRFPQMLGALTACFEDRVQRLVPGGEGLADVLGQTYMMLELGSSRAGQFFTPYSVSRMMALMNVGDGSPHIQREGYVTVHEPACGAGGMVIACADAFNDAGHNYQDVMHATCVDIDPRCVHMTYLQLALLHIPAIVIHGNALSNESWSHWFTPAHILGGWGPRLRRRSREEAVPEHAEPTATVGADTVVQGVAPVIVLPSGGTDPEPRPRICVREDQLALF
ncbi:type I restriction endonuclease subunit M [Burkholderiaceae bacterium 16]|nr:type I restriction endonuclease subunit M [Burkholderiaceae bacterium 16]